MRKITERLPDPVQVIQGRIAINNVKEEDLPKEYLEIVKETLPLERKDRK